MKKYYKEKAMRLVVSLSLIVCLLAGCGNSKTETSPEAATEETAVAEEATEAVKEEPAAEPEIKEEKAVAEESDDNETVSEEDTTEESDSADPGEVTYITDFTSIDDYMESLDINVMPAIVIYNDQEHYIINMEEGQHYQLNAEDQILCNLKEDESIIGLCIPVDLGDGLDVFPNYRKFIVNYSVWDGEEKMYFYRPEDGNNKKIGIDACYLTPPTE